MIQSRSTFDDIFKMIGLVACFFQYSDSNLTDFDLRIVKLSDKKTDRPFRIVHAALRLVLAVHDPDGVLTQQPCR